MTHRRAFAFFFSLGLCACGGSGGGGGGGGPAPINLVNFQLAGAIAGQSLATGSTANNGVGLASPVQNGLSLPGGHVANGSFYVADDSNHRVLGWNAVPTGLGQNANFVIGQIDFATRTAGTSATELMGPRSCWISAGALFVVDRDNNRVLIYSPPPTSNLAASVALGQPDLVTGNATAVQNGLNQPLDVCVAANRIAVADALNNRVLIWNGIPVASGANAQTVVGQPDFATVSPGTTAAKMTTPAGVWTDGTRLVVSEVNNHRVLIWNTFPTTNGQAADLVIGQPDFVTGTSGGGALKMNAPRSVASDGVQLFVADSSNNRVLIYNPFPTVSNAAPTGVLGQNSFTNVAANDDDQNGVPDVTPSARTMNVPRGVTTFGNQVFVNDGNNHRVLIFTGS